MFARTTFIGHLSNKFGTMGTGPYGAERRDLRMRKTTVPIAVLGAALLAVTACSSSKNNNANTPPPGGNTTPPASNTSSSGGGGGAIDGKGAKVGIILPDT